MQYHNFRTMYQSCRDGLTGPARAYPDMRSPHSFYEYLFTDYLGEQSYFTYVLKNKPYEEAMENVRDMMMRAMAEYEWYLADKPCFNIHPQTIQDFCNLSLDAPVSDLEPPFNLPAVVLQFPSKADGNTLGLDKSFLTRIYKDFRKSQKPRKIEIGDLGTEQMVTPDPPEPEDETEPADYPYSDELYVHAVLAFKMIPHRMQKMWHRFGGDIPRGLIQEDRNRLGIWVDGHDPHTTTYRAFTFNEADKYTDKASEYAPPEEERVYADVMKHVIGVHQLVSANSDRIVPEVLNKDRNKMAEAMRKNDIVKMMNLQDKAKRRGVFNWTVMPPKE